MSYATETKVHSTAIVDPRAELGEGVTIGPYTVIEGEVAIGAGTTIGAHCHLLGPMRIGQSNQITSGAILGGLPQDRSFSGGYTWVEIGDNNIIREFVTIHRATTEEHPTRIGNGNMFMVNSHIGHDSIVGNNCILVNGSLVGGHAQLMDRVLLSGNTTVHQFVRVGRLAMLGGLAGTAKDVPPFMIQMGITQVSGVNLVGLRRAGIDPGVITIIKRAYRHLYHGRLGVPDALARIEEELGHVAEIQELVQFCRESKRGICGRSGHLRDRRL